MTSNRKQRITLFLDPSLARQAKIQAVVEELSLTALVEMALFKYLPKEIIIKKKEVILK